MLSSRNHLIFLTSQYVFSTYIYYFPIITIMEFLGNTYDNHTGYVKLEGCINKIGEFPTFHPGFSMVFQHVSVAFFSSFLASAAPPAAGAAATGLAAA